ncbi:MULTISPECIES: hypothetical protein [unclassified Paenibacillus]|uniref:hypothetical protein n=1 Tax=unclassified Paenibacillus TaxID=185978 RepID=UPI0030FAB324
MIPEHLLQDRYWRGLLYIFTHHNKLKQFLKPEFVDFEELTVHVEALLEASKDWSLSEKFMLYAALYIFNGRVKFDMSDADRLNDKDADILITALRMRYAM